MNIKVWEINELSIASCPFLKKLKEVDPIPHHIFVKGNVPKTKYPTAAIVGTRRPTPYGTQVSYELAYKLAQAGCVIVSGLAYGVDAIAHQAALEAKGITLAVLAHGLDQLYPAKHRRLAERIVENRGALLSEYPIGTPARPHHFLARNRLIAGLADILIITEAAERSGTLSTVRYALEQGKDVYAVPGNITGSLSVGPNRLIAEGATPIIDLDAFVKEIVPEATSSREERNDFSPLARELYRLIKQGSSREYLFQQAASNAVAVALTELELDGRIANENGQWIARN